MEQKINDKYQVKKKEDETSAMKHRNLKTAQSLTWHNKLLSYNIIWISNYISLKRSRGLVFNAKMVSENIISTGSYSRFSMQWSSSPGSDLSLI